MSETTRHEITQVLRLLSSGADSTSRSGDRLFELVYVELRRIAHRLMRTERADHTLEPTALVHEAFMRLVNHSEVQWQDRAHFYNTAARAMRRVLVDHARKRASEKRGGNFRKITLNDEIAGDRSSCLEVLALDDCLIRLSQMHERSGRVAEMKIFSGMNLEEIAQALGVSRRTVCDDWAVARRWLAREMTLGDNP